MVGAALEPLAAVDGLSAKGQLHIIFRLRRAAMARAVSAVIGIDDHQRILHRVLLRERIHDGLEISVVFL